MLHLHRQRVRSFFVSFVLTLTLTLTRGVIVGDQVSTLRSPLSQLNGATWSV